MQPVPAATAWSPAEYGQHFPNGLAAVDYLYSPAGMWRDTTGMAYVMNYYEQCATSDKPADPQAMRVMGRTEKLTAPDVNCLILGDINDNGQIVDDQPSGFAFHEHNGRGANGVQRSPPFYQFWFDDNWLARYVSLPYGRPQPQGLHDHGYKLRWRALGGDNNGAVFYDPAPYIDQLALNGIYKLNDGDVEGALADWYAIKDMSGWTYDAANQRYAYPSIRSVYYLGLWGILSERLLAGTGAGFVERNDVLQHAMSIRSNLLSLQERDSSGALLGWKTGIGSPGTLMNTEAISTVVLALGADAKWVFEPGYDPLHSDPGNYVLQPYNVLSAVPGLSIPDYMAFGPYWTLDPGTYAVDFSLRTSDNGSGARLVTVDVYDGTASLKLATITAAMMPANNQWLRYRLTTDIENSSNRMEFRVYWYGEHSLDLGPIRVSKVSDPTN